MKIELEDTTESVYSNFLDYMKSSETRRMYVRNLRQFLNLIPNKIFEDYLSEASKSREIEDLADSFARLAKKDLNATKQIIKSYIKETKKEVELKKYSPSIVKRRVQPIKTLLAANEIDISWSMINKMFPRETRTDDRAYTKEGIQSMLEHCTSIIDKLIILMFSSGGFRLESWDYFCWKYVVFTLDEMYILDDKNNLYSTIEESYSELKKVILLDNGYVLFEEIPSDVSQITIFLKITIIELDESDTPYEDEAEITLR